MENNKIGGCNRRFENLVVPLGLHMVPFVEEIYENLEDHTFCHNNKYDQLLFSVGNDLGKVKKKVCKNRTKKQM
jgi:hypothetical protein